MVLDLASKAVKSIATGNAQADMGLHSPELPSGIDRLGRFLYTVSAGGILITLYTAFVNTRTAPGSGPTLVLPGARDGGYGPSRPDPDIPGLLGKLGIGGGSTPVSSVANDPSLGANAGPVRTRVVKVALQMVNAPNMHYAEVRPIPSNILQNPNNTDCSGFVEQVYMTCGAPDPSGLGFAKPLQGDTGTQESHGTAVKTPNLGDLAFWSDPDHVAIVVSTGNNPWLVSNGGPTGAPPRKIQKSAEDTAHASFLGYRSYI